MKTASQAYLNNIEFDHDELVKICEIWGILRIDLYGSVLSDRFSDNSDIDIIVEFDTDVPHGGFRIAAREDLGEFWGRSVDMCTFEELSNFKNKDAARAVIESEETIYESNGMAHSIPERFFKTLSW